MPSEKTMRIRAYFRALAREGVSDLPNPLKVKHATPLKPRRDDRRDRSCTGLCHPLVASLTHGDVK